MPRSGTCPLCLLPILFYTHYICLFFSSYISDLLEGYTLGHPKPASMVHCNITSTQPTPPSSFLSFHEDVKLFVLFYWLLGEFLIHLLSFRRSPISWSKEQRVWLILASLEAGFTSVLFVCVGLEDSWQPPIYFW